MFRKMVEGTKDLSFTRMPNDLLILYSICFPLVAGFSLDFICKVKVSQKMLKKVKFLTRSGKW